MKLLARSIALLTAMLWAGSAGASVLDLDFTQDQTGTYTYTFAVDPQSSGTVQFQPLLGLLTILPDPPTPLGTWQSNAVLQQFDQNGNLLMTSSDITGANFGPESGSPIGNNLPTIVALLSGTTSLILIDTISDINVASFSSHLELGASGGVSETPLPGSLSLFATSLAAIGLFFGAKRRRLQLNGI